ncbi:hypothetical protein B0H34DRAFT_734171 [Crassisporium funariophilum]|nr:hypothetical protein B0H34DRAFT_734171 [Crassisporium funariophilum]
MTTSNTKATVKKGKDGLTKYQRYYQKHPEVKEKNRERQRCCCELKSQKDAAPSTFSSTQPSLMSPLPNLSEESSTDSSIYEPPTQDIAVKDGPRTMDTVAVEFNIKTDNPSHSLPLDFHRTRSINPDALLGNIINNLVDYDGKKPYPMHYPELEVLLKLHTAVLSWAKGWGGVTYWSIGLDKSFNLAVEERRVEVWQAQLHNHGARGRHMLSRLHFMEGDLPILVKGITILELKSSILSGLCTVTYTESDSAVETDGGETDSGDEGEDEDEDEGEDKNNDGDENNSDGDEVQGSCPSDNDEFHHKWYCMGGHEGPCVY